MEYHFIIWVKDLDDNFILLAGSKVARLGELQKMNLKVPDGFVVSTDAFKLFLKSNDEVIVSEFGFIMHRIYASLQGARVLLAKEKKL